MTGQLRTARARLLARAIEEGFARNGNHEITVTDTKVVTFHYRGTPITQWNMNTNIITQDAPGYENLPSTRANQIKNEHAIDEYRNFLILRDGVKPEEFGGCPTCTDFENGLGCVTCNVGVTGEGRTYNYHRDPAKSERYSLEKAILFGERYSSEPKPLAEVLKTGRFQTTEPNEGGKPR
jgi:hypothetical protein